MTHTSMPHLLSLIIILICLGSSAVASHNKNKDVAYKIHRTILKNHQHPTCCIILMSLDADMDINPSALTTTIYTDEDHKQNNNSPDRSETIAPLYRHASENRPLNHLKVLLPSVCLRPPELTHEFNRSQQDDKTPVSSIELMPLKRTQSLPCSSAKTR